MSRWRQIVLGFFFILSFPVMASERPKSVGFVRSSLVEVNVHFSSQILQDDANFILREIESAWERQVRIQGFASPTNYQLYLHATSDGGAYTRRDENGVYSVFDPSLPRSLWASYVHHEFQHACQYAMGGPSSSVFLDEASAVLQEILAFPNSTYWLEAVQEFQSWPNAPLLASGRDWGRVVGGNSKYDYGGALFLLFLDEKYGSGNGELVRRLWGIGEPWLAAIESVTNTSMQDLVLDFSMWRIFVGKRLGAESLPHTIRVLNVGAIKTLNIDSQRMPRQLGCLLLEHRAVDEGQPLRVLAKSLLPSSEQNHRPLGMAFARVRPDGDVEHGRYRSTGAGIDRELALQKGDLLFVAICDLAADMVFMAPSKHPVEIQFGYKYPDPSSEPSKEVVEENGGSNVISPQKPSGCFCFASLTDLKMRHGLVWLVLLMLLIPRCFTWWKYKNPSC